MLYVFRLMTCEAYYDKHSSPEGPVDRCAKREIEARTAREVALLAGSTTLFGLANLLVTTWSIKRFGIKRALLIQIFWPAVRLAIQNVGVMTGGNAGILIIQCSQIITIIGGPSGYVLTLNSFITDVVKHEERTGALGRLQGCMMIGSALGFLVGGLVGDAFGIIAPYRITLILFLLCCLYVALLLPPISPDKDVAAANKKHGGLLRFFGPLHIFAPQKWVLPNGRTTVQVGALTLGTGVFLGILATGYIPTLLQMYSTDEFGFGTSANGWLIFIYSSLRGLFLSLVFPRIISMGRKWLQPAPGELPPSTEQVEPEAQIPNGGLAASEIDVTDNMDAETEPLRPPSGDSERETFAFDLLYARCSLLADGILTGLAILIGKGWQMYIIATLLPLAAGTGSSAKGTILQMIPSGDRVDALSGLTLVENVARLSTSESFTISKYGG